MLLSLQHSPLFVFALTYRQFFHLFNILLLFIVSKQTIHVPGTGMVGVEIASALDGIIAQDTEDSICNLAELGSVGMNQTDRVILDMMIAK